VDTQRDTRRKDRLSGGSVALFVPALLVLCPTVARSESNDSPNVVIQWNNSVLQGVRDSAIGPPMVARALAIVHTCIFDAWAAYDQHALGTQLGASLRQPSTRRTSANKNKAISFAAYRAAVDLFPRDKPTVFDPLMARQGYAPSDMSTDTSTPSGVGNVACDAVLNFRHNDGSNQLGNLTAGGVPYADYTGYVPLNPPSTVPVNPATIVDVNHWQPLSYFDATGTFVTPKYIAPFWGNVAPFALTSGDQFRSLIAQSGPVLFGSPTFLEQAQELVTLSANLTDERKMIAEYWANGPHSELPPGHWDLFAQFVSARDHHELADDVKLFFAMTNAIFDAGIVSWDAKRAFNWVRPATAIPFLFQGQEIEGWGGPGKGTVTMEGRDWIPYQPSTFPTPPFPECSSGHSTFSAAGAEILKLFTGSDDFGEFVTFEAGSSVIEPGLTPRQPVTLSWRTFADAADQAGISRRYGGIHFKIGDLTGRLTGRLAADQAWIKARNFWSGGKADDDLGED
jgi:hypothetical protein